MPDPAPVQPVLSPAQARWRLAGLVAWLWLTPVLLTYALAVNVWFGSRVGGSMVVINFPGPKVWAMPLLQRSHGNEPGVLGVSGTVLTLVQVGVVGVAVGAMRGVWSGPARRLQPPCLRAHGWMPWLPLLGVAGMLGALLHIGSINPSGDDRSGAWALTAVLGVEVPGTLLVYFALAALAARLGEGATATGLRVSGAVAAVLMIAAAATVPLGEDIHERTASWPVQLWASGFGAVSTAAGVFAAAMVMRLLGPLARAAELGRAAAWWRRAWAERHERRTSSESGERRDTCGECGYTLRGLPDGAACPECGSLEESPGEVSVAERAWARVVLLGLAVWLLATPMAAYVVLIMRFRDDLGGTLPLLNFPGPKVWAMSHLQRIVGDYVTGLGAGGAWWGWVNLLAIFLLTSPRSRRAWDESTLDPRRLARWAAVLGGGAFFGLTLIGRDLNVNQPGFWKFALAAVACELPGTVLLYLYLGRLAGSLGDEGAKRMLWWAGGLAGAVMLAAAAMLLPQVAAMRQFDGESVVQALAAGYGAVAVGGAALGVGGTLRVMGRVWRRAV